MQQWIHFTNTGPGAMFFSSCVPSANLEDVPALRSQRVPQKDSKDADVWNVTDYMISLFKKEPLQKKKQMKSRLFF